MPGLRTRARRIAVSLLAFMSTATAAPAADPPDDGLVLECARFRAVLGPDAVWRSLVERESGRELLAPGVRVAFAAAAFEPEAAAAGAGTDSNVHDQQKRIAAAATGLRTVQASRAALAGDRLTVGFTGVDCELTYRIVKAADWLVFVLERVRGRRPWMLQFVQVAVAPSARVGPRLAAGWDAETAVGLATVNLQAYASARKRKDHAFVLATTQDAPGPKLEGAGVALLAARPDVYRDVLRKLSAGFGLPRNEDGNGVPAKALPLAKASYWFLGFGEADVEKVIGICRQSGFRQVMLNSGSWCRSPGHYLFNTTMYPDGRESLRRTVARLHEAGILVGMHCFASKVAKIDPYVTPVPDRRFWVDRACVLAGDVGAEEKTIRTKTDLREWPGSPVASQTLWEGGVARHQEVVLEGEIVRYESIGPEGRWDTFQGCTRGAWKTRPAAHRAGTTGRHYGVDGCINGYVIDQETDLLDEVTTRLAGIFNDCGFDMVYFDGGEDVDRRRFVHYVSKFQAAAMAKFAKRPVVHMGTIMTHTLWHSFARSGTVDTYQNTIRGHLLAGGKVGTWPTVRQHIDRSVDYMTRISDDMMPGELGWFGIWPRDRNTEGLQLDAFEYLMVRSLAYDAPISLQTSFSRMETHPLTPGILEIARVYEGLRMAGTIPEADRTPLRVKGVDFALVRFGGRLRFVRLEASFKVAEGLRASVGALDGGAVAVLWGMEQEATLRVPLARGAVCAEAVDGTAVEPGGDAKGVAFRLGPRRVAIRASGLPPAALRTALSRASVRNE